MKENSFLKNRKSLFLTGMIIILAVLLVLFIPRNNHSLKIVQQNLNEWQLINHEERDITFCVQQSDGKEWTLNSEETIHIPKGSLNLKVIETKAEMLSLNLDAAKNHTVCEINLPVSAGSSDEGRTILVLKSQTLTKNSEYDLYGVFEGKGVIEYPSDSARGNFKTTQNFDEGVIVSFTIN